MSGENILLVEDDEYILELLKVGLAEDGFDVIGVTSGESALDIIKSYIPDLILLDVNLPGMSGLELCQKLKTSDNFCNVPVILQTTQGEEDDIVRGLELGADDYIIKPYSQKILSARINTVLRRTPKKIEDLSSVIKIQDLLIDPKRYEVFVVNKHVDLSSTEFKLLYFLASKPGWVFTRNQILEEVKGEDDLRTERSVDVIIAGLRKKLDKYSSYIETIRGVGYCFRE